MRMMTFDPPAALAPFVRNFTVVEVGAETTRLLVPDTAVALGVRFRGAAVMVEGDGGAAVRLPDATFTGLRRTARRIRTSAGGGMVLAMFREGGVAPFFGEPLHEYFGETVGLDGLASRAEVERVGSQVVEARDHAGRVEALSRFLLARRAERGPDPVVQAAVRAIHAGRGAVRVADVAESLGIGQDRLEKRFRRAVGASPKQFASIVRVRHVIASHRRGMSLTRLAVEAGYADQSHFIREFKSVTGLSPGRFFREEAAGQHC